MSSKPLISVVDDDESIRESLPDLLRELGFDVQAFSSGEAFLASEHRRRTACVILDIAMPGMSGFDVLRTLRERGWEIPTIFITAHADAGHRPQLLQPGVVEVLAKPFTEDALLAAIDTALRTP
jgi:FixJ family two-component response regulator